MSIFLTYIAHANQGKFSRSELILIFFPNPNFRLALLHGELNVGKKMSPEFMLMFKKDYASLITLPDVD